MADDILSQFLIRIAYSQDEKSRQKFNEGLQQVQTRAVEFGAKIGELPAIVNDVIRRKRMALRRGNLVVIGIPFDLCAIFPKIRSVTG